MVVITLTDCPTALRGDLSKWLFEVNTGVYCGNISARVRDELWNRICENIKDGRATMVFNAAGEQHLDFKVHNSNWEPVDFDGIKLMRHPSSKRRKTNIESQDPKTRKLSLTETQKLNRYKNRKKREVFDSHDYCVIDLETTGISVYDDHIIEIGLLRVRNEEIEDQFECFINNGYVISKEIENLTGISTQMLNANGIDLDSAISRTIDFIGDDILVGYNLRFDYSFLQNSIESVGKERINNKQIDVMSIARKKLDDIDDYKLSTVAHYFSIEQKTQHRALEDCFTTYEVFKKLKEI